MLTRIMPALATLGAAGIFAATFHFQRLLRCPAEGQRGYRRVVSFSAGTAVAYVFVHLLPEVGAASERVARLGEGREVPFAEVRVYAAALLGFMLFYGLEHMVRWRGVPRAGQESEDGGERTQLRILTVSYALYVLVVSYLMAHTMEAGGGQLALFALAMALHFLGVGYGLRRENQALYDGWGSRLLAAAALAGWAGGALFPIGEHASNMLLGLVAGCLIMNTVTGELPGERDGRFGAFLGGGVFYTAVLLLIAA